MKQCPDCYRFLPDRDKNCRYCGTLDPSLFESLLSRKFLEENRNYRLHVSGIEIDGSAYEVVAPLDRGGFSVILKVRCIDKDEIYALKLPLLFDEVFSNRQGNAEAMLRKSEKAILDEIDALNRMNRMYALEIYYRGNVTVINKKRKLSMPGILMEIADTTLCQIIHNQAEGRNHVPMGEKVKMVRDILYGLWYMHDQRLIHRDISPDNIFVVNRAGDLRYIVSDYGTSRCHDDITSAMLSSHIMAHQPYLDPERLNRADFDYDPRSDIYSTGIIIAEIFLGNFWTRCVDPGKYNAHQLNFEMDILENYLYPFFDRRLYRIIKKAVAYKASKRYKSIRQLHREMERYFSRLKVKPVHSIRDIYALKLHVGYRIELPMDLDVNTFEEVEPFKEMETVYGGNNFIRFDELGHFTIRFKKRVLLQVRLMGTKLFRLSFDDQAIRLEVDAKRWRRRYRRFRDILRRSDGHLDMGFWLEISCLMV